MLRAFALKPLEAPIKVGDGLEPCLERHLRDPSVGILQKILGFGDSHLREVLGERESRRFFENLTEIKDAHVELPCDRPNVQVLLLVLTDEVARLLN